MADSDYSINGIYQGGYSTLDPKKSDLYTGYSTSAKTIGMPTDPRVANILKELNSKVNPGQQVMDIVLINPEIVDAIPKQYVEETKRLAKLTGVDLSVHGPVINTAGVGQSGYSELNRELSEKQLFRAVETAHNLDPDGNIPVTFHSAEGFPASQFKKDKNAPGGKKEVQLIAINRETGKMAPVIEERRHYPKFKDVAKGKIENPREELNILNYSEWDNSVSTAVFNKEAGDKILEETYPLVQKYLSDLNSGKLKWENLKPEQKDVFSRIKNADEYMKHTQLTLNSLFNKAYKYGTPESREILDGVANAYKEEINKMEEEGGSDPKQHSRALQILINGLQDKGEKKVSPDMYIPVEDFAIEKSSKTFGNVAFESFKKYGKNSPIVSIENPPAGFALSTGEDLKKLVEKTREHFIERVMKSKKDKGLELSRSEAEKQAEKLIGATWDVGHINQIRKFGFDEEDTVNEAKKVAPLLKHIHLSDNFGIENTELPMGMGNVALEKVMKVFGKKGEDAKKIVEAGHWWQHFSDQGKNFITQQSFEALGSHIYAMGSGPSWSQSYGLTQGYFGGYGQMLPSINYETFGAGFSNLPAELGGNRPQGGAGSRMSGRGME